MMKLGGYYRTRGGRVKGPLLSLGQRIYPYCIGSILYTEAGRTRLEFETPDDLVHLLGESLDSDDKLTAGCKYITANGYTVEPEETKGEGIYKALVGNCIRLWNSNGESRENSDYNIVAKMYSTAAESAAINSKEVGAPMIRTKESFMDRVKSALTQMIAWAKELMSKPFEMVGKAADFVKDFFKNNPIFSFIKKLVSRVKAITRNPKRWLLAAFGASFLSNDFVALLGNALELVMKIAKEWLPTAVYTKIEALITKVTGIFAKVVNALLNNKPVAYLRRLVSALFAKVKGWYMAVREYVKRKLTELLVNQALGGVPVNTRGDLR